MRIAAVVVGVAFLAAAGIVQQAHESLTLALYLTIAGLLVLASIYTIRLPSAPRENRDQGCWQMTGERFRDPSTGHLMELRHNPVTGEKDYVEVEE